MKQLLLFFPVLIITTSAFAQTNIYSSLTLPDSMKKNADVVTREEYIKFTVKDINSAKYEVHEVYTILNEQGKEYLSFEEYSDKFDYLDDAEIKVYDAFGNRTNTYSKKEMATEGYGSGLVADGKITHFHVNAPSYPITVEMNYTRKYKGLFVYPGNFFQLSNQSVQKAVFDVEVPSSLSLRYKLLNCNYEPVVTKHDDKDLYHWQVQHLTAFKPESHSGSSDNYLPVVLLGPTKFQLDDYDGDMTSWKNFGDWYNRVYQKTTELKEERKVFYNLLVKDAKTDKEKAAILYNYLQNNMRYVSIQLGIGGLRPFPASFVDEKKYGDCKALSNYLKSALDAVGVKANVVIIQGGMAPRNVYDDFPAHYFNHAILCVPQPKDSIWLECTSTTLPFAELGPFTENRKGMMITDNGGVLVKTPVSSFQNNTTAFSTIITVNEEGNAQVNAIYTSTGEERDNLLMRFHDMKEDDKRKYFINYTEWKQPDVLALSNSDKTARPYQVNAKMEYENIASFKAGNKLFLEPRLYHFFDADIPETEKRTRDYFFECPYQQTDTTVYILPAGFTTESLPKNKIVNYPFASYTSTYTWNAVAHKLTCMAVIQVKERTVKAADYARLLDLKKQVMADANEKIVVKKE